MTEHPELFCSTGKSPRDNSTCCKCCTCSRTVPQPAEAPWNHTHAVIYPPGPERCGAGADGASRLHPPRSAGGHTAVTPGTARAAGHSQKLYLGSLPAPAKHRHTTAQCRRECPELDAFWDTHPTQRGRSGLLHTVAPDFGPISAAWHETLRKLQGPFLSGSKFLLGGVYEFICIYYLQKIQVSQVCHCYLYSSLTQDSLMVKNKIQIYRQSGRSDFQLQS